MLTGGYQNDKNIEPLNKNELNLKLFIQNNIYIQDHSQRKRTEAKQ